VYHSTDLAYVFLEISPSQVEYYNLAKEMVNYWFVILVLELAQES
jgi:hypothetical protein